MRDFTLDIYRELLETLSGQGYAIISFKDYCRKSKVESRKSKDKFVILRHDVDAKPDNSLKTAQIEHAIGAKATYYFRKPTSMTEPEIIRAIVALGHEIGYHYEDMSLCGGRAEEAWIHFQTWLDYFRQYYAVETICMHGAPTSQWDGKELWKTYDYKSLGILGEPYLDTNFEDVFYLTDTGRCWDGYKVSVRDKIAGYQDQWTAAGLTWHTTHELLRAIKEERLPKHVMITTHPQRWTNNKGAWFKEAIMQSLKNSIKRIIVKQNNE